MGITRREFLNRGAGVALMTLPLLRWRGIERNCGCVVLDLQEHCSLRESVWGYDSVLASFNVPRCDGLIVPAALTIPPGAVQALVGALQRGATVILESGAGFAPADGPEFRVHQGVLRDALQLRVESPVDVWTADTRRRGVPYVDFMWPCAAKVRDFSRVVPLGHEEGKIIARVNGMPVALARRMGRGTLVFLGSPVGPALWTGDVEAKRWLREVLSAAWWAKFAQAAVSR